MTLVDRRLLARELVPEGIIGYDCNGTYIRKDDIVEVVEEDETRKRFSEYDFCSVGKRGKASRHFTFPAGWFVTVDFGGEEKTVGCLDISLKKVS